jgi:hypothetical protein
MERGALEITWNTAGGIATGYELYRYVGEYSASATPAATFHIPASTYYTSTGGPVYSMGRSVDLSADPNEAYQYRIVPQNFQGQSVAVLSNVEYPIPPIPVINMPEGPYHTKQDLKIEP